MTDIFISYAAEDRPTAEKLALQLTNEGWAVFWDRVIPPGKTWRDIIGSRLAEAQCIVVLWSKASVSSHWVLEEAENARQRGNLFPVLLEDVQPPLGFRSLQAADLSRWDGSPSDRLLESVLTDLGTTLGEMRTPGTGPTVPNATAQEAHSKHSSRSVQEDSAQKTPSQVGPAIVAACLVGAGWMAFVVMARATRSDTGGVLALMISSAVIA